MKKIFLESHHLKNPFFGFGQFNLHLVKALAKIPQDQFEFIIHGSRKSFEEKFGDNVKFKSYHSFRRYSSFRIREKFDLWHSLNQNTRIEPKNALPYLLTIHNITYIKNKENYLQEEVHQRFQEKLNRSSAITYISEYAKSSTHDFFEVPDVPEFVIYNGNPVKEISIPENFLPQLKPKRSFLFSIGEFTERKNFKSLIKMLKFLPEYDLVIAGKKNTAIGEEIKRRISLANFQDRIFLPGKISEEDKQYYYQNCEAFVFPSLREGFGLPIIEAMRFGKPVFTSKNTSLPEIGGEFAFYWDHFEAEYMAEIFRIGIKKYKKNKEWYQEQLISHAKSFDWNTAAREYLKVYQALL